MNLGCGRRPHPGWINVDLEESAGVAAIDFRLPLPSPDDYLEAVYASHVLEHFGVAVSSMNRQSRDGLNSIWMLSTLGLHRANRILCMAKR